MRLTQIGILVNLGIAIFNILIGSINHLIYNNFNSMVYCLLLSISNLLFATVLSVIDKNNNQ